ncbi:hypothetical protein PILCRDRAFT_637879 [Piloderma croceum F 1598]|uniref:Uncharacterized protein n=1 Tax=Piloderma croceum (strain F 1598) TaxID=765440 RepID=A0A0C3BHI3_PILCF|nr:hypothetical protein PILCRDRAFT_637879 [Piloderma croceum F 1598]
MSQANPRCLLRALFSNRGTRKVPFDPFSYIDAQRPLRRCSSGADFGHFGGLSMTRGRLTLQSSTKPEHYVDQQLRV